MSKTQWLITVLVVLVVAFVGSMAGSWFAGWRQEKAHHKKLEKLYSSSPASILIGDTLPEVELIDVDGKTVDLKALIDGRKTLIFFLAPTCDMCTDLIDAYRRESEGFSTGLEAFGICPDVPDMARVYAEENDLPFPLFCDTAQSFQSEHGVVAFPTLMALDTNGVIQYLNFGMMDDYDFEDIQEILDHY
jgi:peroxiredoxin